MVDINLLGMLHAIHAGLPTMKKQGASHTSWLFHLERAATFRLIAGIALHVRMVCVSVLSANFESMKQKRAEYLS
jgi:NAD(P)-dependent dehydrogenase (short-subunit alcohol dehydrogenase family)